MLKIWKITCLTAGVILLACLLGLIFTDVSVKASPQTLAYTTAEGEASTADYYPGSGNSAILVAGGSSGTAEKALLSRLLPQGLPVMVTKHSQASGDELKILEAETALLAQKSGLPESELILVGFHSGAGALLDEMMNGSHSYKAMALLSPVLPNHRIDEGTIVNGNYHNESDWIRALSPGMVRQPTILISSNGDDVSSPYGMTLIYNKLSGDEIIHLGGVYGASKGSLSLSVVDGGFHPNTPYNGRVLSELFRFLNAQDSSFDFSLGLAVPLRVWLRVGLMISLFALLLCVCALTRYRLTDVSYGLSAPMKLEKPVAFFTAKALAWVVTIPAVFLLMPVMKYIEGNSSSRSVFTLVLFSFSMIYMAAKKLMKIPKIRFFRSVSLKPGRLAMGLFYCVAVLAVLAVLPFSGYSFSLPGVYDILPLAASCLMTLFWFRMGLGEEALIQDTKSGWPLKLACILFQYIPLILFAVGYAVFQGNTAALSCVILLGLLVGAALLSKGIFRLTGSTFLASLLAAASFQATAAVMTLPS